MYESQYTQQFFPYLVHVKTFQITINQDASQELAEKRGLASIEITFFNVDAYYYWKLRVIIIYQGLT